MVKKVTCSLRQRDGEFLWLPGKAQESKAWQRKYWGCREKIRQEHIQEDIQKALSFLNPQDLDDKEESRTWLPSCALAFTQDSSHLAFSI